MPIQGCIFDLDGVLTDTAEYHYQAWQRLADELGVPFDRQRNEALRGVSRRRSLELLLAGRVYPEAQMLEMMERSLLKRVLEHTAGNQSRAAKILGITRASLRHKLKLQHISTSHVVSIDEDELEVARNSD